MGGIVNQVTVGAPKSNGSSGRALLQGSPDDGLHSDGIGYKAGGLFQYKAGDFDATIGSVYEKRGIFYDGDDRRVGLNLTQGETQDSKTTNFFARFGYAISGTGRLDLIASRFEMKGGGDYLAVPGVRQPYRSGLNDVPTSAIPGDAPGVPAPGRTEPLALSYSDTDLAGGNFVSQLVFNRSRDTFGGAIAPIPTFQDPALAPLNQLFNESQNRSRKAGRQVQLRADAVQRADRNDRLRCDERQDGAAAHRHRSRLGAADRLSQPGAVRGVQFPAAGRQGPACRWRAMGERADRGAGLLHIGLDDRSGTPNNPAAYGGVAVSGGAPKSSDLLLNVWRIAGNPHYRRIPGV